MVVFVCGLLPTLFLVTGAMIWLRSRNTRMAAVSVAGEPQFDAAE
jgi:hypothetical protein